MVEAEADAEAEAKGERGLGVEPVEWRDEAEEALEEWLGVRMEVGAREWLVGLDWVFWRMTEVDRKRARRVGRAGWSS